MFRSHVPAAAGRRSAWMTLGLMTALLAAAAVYAQQPAAPARSPLAYSGDAGMIIHYVKADKAADFEMVMGKVKEALNKSDNADAAVTIPNSTRGVNCGNARLRGVRSLMMRRCRRGGRRACARSTGYC